MSGRSSQRGAEAPGAAHYLVRAYLHQHREGRSPEGRIRLHADDCGSRPVVGLLVAGYSEVSPQSAIASALLDRLTAIIQGPLGLVAHYRDTSPQLAAWLAKELIERTTVEITSTNYLPTRPQGARR